MRTLAVKVAAGVLGVVRVFEGDEAESRRVSGDPSRNNFAVVAEEVF